MHIYYNIFYIIINKKSYPCGGGNGDITIIPALEDNTPVETTDMSDDGLGFMSPARD